MDDWRSGSEGTDLTKNRSENCVDTKKVGFKDPRMQFVNIRGKANGYCFVVVIICHEEVVRWKHQTSINHVDKASRKYMHMHQAPAPEMQLENLWFHPLARADT